MFKKSFRSILSKISMLFIIVISLLLFCGCAGTHLYNKHNHEMALKANGSLKKVELSKCLIMERERHAEHLRQEIEIIRRQTLARRDAQLIAIIGSEDRSFNNFREAINKRLTKLLCSEPDIIDGFVRTINMLAAQKQKLSNIAETYNFLPEASKHPLSCSDKPLPDVEEDMLQAIRNEYSIECNKYLKLESKLNDIAFTGGIFGKIIGEITSVESLQDNIASELESRKNDYDKALKAKKNKPQEITALAKEISNKLEALDETFSLGTKVLGILGFGDLTLIGHIEKLEEQRKSIGTIIDKISKGESLAETDATSDTKIDIRIASTIDSLAKLYTKFNTLPLNALILQNEKLRIEVDGLRRRVANAEERLILMKRKRDAIKFEMDSLIEAGKYLTFAEKECGEITLISNFIPKSKTVTGTDITSYCRDNIGRSLLYYANSWSIGRFAQDEIDYLLIGNQHKQALDDSEIALAHWENLLGVPVIQLVAFHGAGLTPDEIAKLGLGIANLTGLSVIAARVD